MDGEGNETDDSDDCPPPGHSDTPGDTGVTATDLCNLRQNASVHDKNTENNEEDRQSTASEEEESITPSENENDPNDHKNDHKTKSSNRINGKRMNWRTRAMKNYMTRIQECLSQTMKTTTQLDK